MPVTRKERRAAAGGAAAGAAAGGVSLDEPSHDELEQLQSMSDTLFMTLCSHPRFNRAAPDQSPRTLWFAADFVRRTNLEYIAPLCPSEAGGAWPRFNRGRYNDSVSRGMLIASIILDPRKQVMAGGPFDFGVHVRDIARFLLAEDNQPETGQLESIRGMSEEQIDEMNAAVSPTTATTTTTAPAPPAADNGEGNVD